MTFKVKGGWLMTAIVVLGMFASMHALGDSLMCWFAGTFACSTLLLATHRLATYRHSLTPYPQRQTP